MLIRSAFVLLIVVLLAPAAWAQTNNKGTVAAEKGATLELVTDGDDEEAEKATPSKTLELPPGEHTVILHKSGKYPVRGTVMVREGKITTVSALAEEVPPRAELEAWSVLSLTAGTAALTTAVVLELSSDEDSIEASASKFALAGVGAVLMVSGGILLKWVRDERSDPEARDGSFTVGATPIRGGGGYFAATGSF
jgi:hypothetical protein